MLFSSSSERLLYSVETAPQFVPDTTTIHRFEVTEDDTSLLKGQVFHTMMPDHANGTRCDEGKVISGPGLLTASMYQPAVLDKIQTCLYGLDVAK